jgi:hypothetical protein
MPKSPHKIQQNPQRGHESAENASANAQKNSNHLRLTLTYS